MKKPNPRELKLVILTGLFLFAAATYVVLKHHIAQYKTFEEEWLAERIAAAQNENLLDQEPALYVELEAIRSELPTHPLEKDLNSTFSRQLEALSASSGLRLTGRTPRPEDYLEDLNLYQTVIRCTWEGSSEQLIDFLFQIQKLGAVADTRELRIQNRRGLAESLSGSLVLEFIYARSDIIANSQTE